jgi:TonB family protein
MNTFGRRTLISTVATTIVHASLFYSLNSVQQPIIVTQKVIKIALLNKEEIAKKEETKPKPIVKAKPKPIVKAKPKPIVKAKPKPIVKAKPKPIVKAKPKPIVKAKPKPIVKAKPTVIPYTEPKKIVQNEINTKLKERLLAQEARKKQEAKSKKIQNELTLYLSKVRAKIQKNLRYPALAKRLKLEGESVVAFKILPDGHVDSSSIKTENSSGYKSLDRQAIETILSVSPFDIPPQSNMSIVLPVAFALDK